jgi:pimeloyl-ACP methyl ester carboxylesterase
MPSGQSALTPALDADVESLETTSAGTLRYYVDRSGEGRPLVLLHSINAAPSAMEMKPMFEHFRGRRPVFAPDLPGFGLSDRRAWDYTPSLYATAITELLRAAGGPAVDVVALSLTAEFAARCIVENPDACRSLAIISPTGLGDREPPGARTSARLRRFFSLPLLDRGLYRLLTSRASIRYFLGLAFEGEVPQEVIDYAYATAHRPGAHFAPYCFLSGGLFTAGARTKLYEPLPVPGLVIYDRDPNVAFTQLPALLETAPRWQAQRIAPTRGLPHWEQTERTCSSLEQFWSTSEQCEQAGA